MAWISIGLRKTGSVKPLALTVHCLQNLGYICNCGAFCLILINFLYTYVKYARTTTHGKAYICITHCVAWISLGKIKKDESWNFVFLPKRRAWNFEWGYFNGFMAFKKMLWSDLFVSCIRLHHWASSSLMIIILSL